MRMILAIAVLLLGSSAIRADDVTAEHKLVEANCSCCHAIGKTGESPLARAPPFREVVKRYPVESLGEALVEGIVTGHNEMPEFTFEPDKASEIVAYLNSLT
jgi:cytochrome c